MRKKFNINLAINTLISKKVLITGTHIDVSKAVDLGNKSWGYIDGLQKVGYKLTGQRDYRGSYAVKEEEKPKTKISTEVKEKQTPKTKLSHSNADLKESYTTKGKKLKCSEFQQLTVINNLQDKYKRINLKHPLDEVKLLKEIKKEIKAGNGRPFYNEKIWSSEYETVKEIPTNHGK